MDKKVLIGMPCGSGMVPTVMLQSLLMLQKPLACGFMSVDRQRIDKARNAIALEALKGGFDYLLFVDDDNPIPPETLVQFIEDDKDIVIAPIVGRHLDKDGNGRLCAFYADEYEVEGKPMRFYNNIVEFRDEGPLHKIDGGGTGCMLIKRKVLEKLFAKYREYIFEFGDMRFEETEINGQKYDRRTMSEDVEFCERAIDAGFEIWLDERIKPTHLSGYRALQWSKPVTEPQNG